ncbi:MAG: nucleotidyl transferase AbiEii/AbiGii toxin family protein [Nanoarchaeota archaeon]
MKKASHKEIAKAQDVIVEILYNIFDDAVIHGGTAIWRCYNGNRFSEDVDVYIEKDDTNIKKFFELIEKKGLTIERKKIGENSIYSTLKFNRTIVRFEAIFKKIKGTLKEYETAEGNFLTVYTLSSEELINEKVQAYIQRLKVRDLYDVFFLLRYIKNPILIEKQINRLIKNFKKPIDEKDLDVLILEGLIPKTQQMIDYIKDRV